MNIQESTRQMIIDELLMIGCVTGQMGVAEFVRKVYPKANNLPTTDYRFGMTTAIDDIRQHMDRNNDWGFEELFYSYLDFLKIDDEDFKYFLAQYVHPSIRRFQINDELEKIPFSNDVCVATVYKGNIIKNLIMDCQSYTKYRPNETTGGIFVSWRRKEELPTGA